MRPDLQRGYKWLGSFHSNGVYLLTAGKSLLRAGKKSLSRHEVSTSLQQHWVQETLLFSLIIWVAYQGLLQKNDMETLLSIRAQ